VKVLSGVLGVALFLGLCVTARAQFTGDTELGRNWQVRLGFFIPEREVARAAEGDIWLTLGAERPFMETDRWRGTVSVDYYGSGSIYNVPITLNVRGESNRLRYGAGAGIGIGHDAERGVTNFTYNLLLGYTLGTGATPPTADVRYMGAGRGGGALNGWAFTLGYSF
jgi:hypothetical protein